jgi:hypothetical protein
MRRKKSMKKIMTIIMLAACLIGATLTASADPNQSHLSLKPPKIVLQWLNSTSVGYVRLADQPWTIQIDHSNDDFFTYANLSLFDNQSCAESRDFTDGSLVNNVLTLYGENTQVASQWRPSHDVAMANGYSYHDIIFKTDSPRTVRVKIEITYFLMVHTIGDYWGSSHYSVFLNQQYADASIDLFHAGTEVRENTTTLYANIPSGALGHLTIQSDGCVYAPVEGNSTSSGSGYATAYVTLRMTAV